MNILKWIGGFFFVGMIILLLVLFIGTCNTGARMIQNAQNVVYDQFSPSELLKKYEWFKDASAQLDAKVATIEAYNTRFTDLKQEYGVDSSHRNKWSRDDKEQWNIWMSELTGVKASYNTLSADYNAAMAKFNYRFCNVGGLPQGYTPAQTLPREYKPYIYQ